MNDPLPNRASACELGTGAGPTASLEHLGMLAQHSGVGIWHITAGGYTLYVNPAMCRMLQIDSLDQIRQITYHQFFTPDTLQTMAREHARRRSGECSTYEVELLGMQGEHRHALLSGVPLFNAQGQLESMIGTFTDITERKRADQALQDLLVGMGIAGREFFPELAWHLTVALGARITCVFQTIPSQPELLRVITCWGYADLRPGQVVAIDQTPCSIMRDQRRYCCPQGLSRMAVDHPLFQKLRVQSLLGAALFDSHDDLIGYICLLGDQPLTDPDRAMTVLQVLASRASLELERDRLSEALFLSEERFALVAQGAGDVLWDWNIKADQFYCSPRLTQQLGYLAREWSCSSIHRFKRIVHPDDLPVFEAALAAGLEGSISNFTCRLRLRDRAGEFLQVTLRGQTLAAFGKAYRMAGSMAVAGV